MKWRITIAAFLFLLVTPACSAQMSPVMVDTAIRVGEGLVALGSTILAANEFSSPAQEMAARRNSVDHAKARHGEAEVSEVMARTAGLNLASVYDCAHIWDCPDGRTVLVDPAHNGDGTAIRVVERGVPDSGLTDPANMVTAFKSTKGVRSLVNQGCHPRLHNEHPMAAPAPTPEKQGTPSPMARMMAQRAAYEEAR